MTDDQFTTRYDEPAVVFQAEMLMQAIAGHFTDWMARSITSDVPPNVRVAATTYVFATLIATLATYSITAEHMDAFIDLVCKNIANAAKASETPREPHERPN